MLVSVIIPMYNVEKTIEDTYRSLCRQSYKNIEIIFVDNNSTDKSYSMVTNYQYIDPRVRVFKEEQKGVSYARKKGFQESTGKYVYFIDGDDCVSKKGIEKMVLVAEKYQADIVQGHFLRVKDKRYIPKYDKKHDHGLRDISKNKPANLLYHLPPLWMRLYKKELIQEHYFVPIQQKEDNLFTYYAFADAERVIQIPDIIYYYLQTANGLSSLEQTIPYHIYVNQFAKILKYYADKGILTACEEEIRTNFTLELLDFLKRMIYLNRTLVLEQSIQLLEEPKEKYEDNYENEQQIEQLISLLAPYENQEIFKDAVSVCELLRTSVEKRPYEKIKMKKRG